MVILTYTEKQTLLPAGRKNCYLSKGASTKSVQVIKTWTGVLNCYFHYCVICQHFSFLTLLYLLDEGFLLSCSLNSINTTIAVINIKVKNNSGVAL